MLQTLKKVAAQLPVRWQQMIRQQIYSYQLRRGTFKTNEQEYEVIDSLVSSGDWVIDLGANIGHYTAKLSKLVGAHGWVVAIEPIPQTFALLAANAQLFPFKNVTLLNIAVSDEAALKNMDIPLFDTGLKDYYSAHISSSGSGQNVLCLPLDVLPWPSRVSFVKIDVEQHDIPVLKSMQKLIQRDHPNILMEVNEQTTIEFLENLGYRSEQAPGSVNSIFRYSSS